MKYLLVFSSLAVFWNSLEAFPRQPPVRSPVRSSPKPLSLSESTLRLVNVLWRHGNRNPIESSIWKGNSFANESYYPEGFEQLTNAGKMTAYKLGKLLRERYDDFLGDTWDINIQDFRSTDINRTKMTGSLVMAGLWPPRGSNVWNSELPWQPIPYNYWQSDADFLLMPFSCSTFEQLYAEVFYSEEIQNYLGERYGETMKIVSANTGVDEDDYTSAFDFFNAMVVQQDLGYPLDEWTEQVYPEPLNSLSVDIYYIMTNNTGLRQLVAGRLVQKILNDAQNKANGTLSPSTRKLFAYSAHDVNVGSMILSLDAYKPAQTPPYASAVIFEVHEILGEWGLKLFYIDYTEGSPHLLTIPGCDEFCPLDQFYNLVEEILPTSDEC